MAVCEFRSLSQVQCWVFFGVIETKMRKKNKDLHQALAASVFQEQPEILHHQGEDCLSALQSASLACSREVCGAAKVLLSQPSGLEWICSAVCNLGMQGENAVGTDACIIDVAAFCTHDSLMYTSCEHAETLFCPDTCTGRECVLATAVLCQCMLLGQMAHCHYQLLTAYK